MEERYTFLTIHLPQETLEKFEYMIAQECHSMNSKLDELVRQHIAEFEAQHGEIPVDDKRPPRQRKFTSSCGSAPPR